MDSLTAASIIDSTIGAALLGVLEQVAVFGDVPEEDEPLPLQTSAPESVQRAAEWAHDLPFGELVKLAVVAESCVGSFWGHSRSVPALRLREGRRPIAEALAGRSDVSLWSAPAADEQWWWTDERDIPVDVLGRRLDVKSSVWRTMPFHGLATTSPFPAEMLATGVSAPIDLVWDICFGPVARWRLLVANSARVFQVDGPDDWENLVRTYPNDASTAFNGDAREISSASDDQSPGGLAAVLAVPGQRAVRRGWRRFLTPDWEAVGADWDGVHLSWAGFLLTDGTAIDLGDGDITMLRNWGSERTVWLAPVLRDPVPLPVPQDQYENALGLEEPAWDRQRKALVRFVCPPQS